MNFEAKKTELEAAGYTLQGVTVYDAAGNPVAGAAAYGDVWCKSDDVKAIMDRPAPKPKAKKKVEEE